MRLRLPSQPKYSRDAWLLIAVSAVFAVGFAGIQNLLRVLYVLRLGFGPEYVGLFNASGAMSYMAMSLPSGALGQRLGARKTMLIGSVVAVLGLAALPMSESAPDALRAVWPIASQVLTSLGWSMVNINLVPALVAATTVENRAGAYAINSSVRCLGTFLGTIVGGMLPALFGGVSGETLDAPGPYGLSLWVAAVLSIVAVVPVAMVRGGRAPAARTHGEDPEPFPFGSVAFLVSHVVLIHGGWATLQAFGNAYMDTDLLLPASVIGAITGLAQLFSTGTSLVTPKISRRFGDGWTLMASAVAMGLSLAPIALIPHWSAAGLARIGNLSFEAIWLPALQVYQMARVSDRWRSLAYSIVNMAMGLAFASVSLIGGYIAASAGYQTLFIAGLALCMAGAALMFLKLRRERAAARPHTTLQTPPA